MALTVRLPASTERVLDELARRRGQTRSDVVREAIERFGSMAEPPRGVPRAIDAWADVIGIVALSGSSRRGTTGELFTAIVQEKRRARRTR
jgi:Arc/MetJ-type ribon-helix-helix transcriptional regulator